MKNRDNEFFIEEKLDELVQEGNKDALKDQLSRILAYPCCLNGFKHCKKYLQAFTEEEIVQTPYLATAASVISAIYGDLERAEQYAACVESEPVMKLHLDVMIPGTDNERVMRAYILEERYLAMLSLAEYLREPLRKGGRTMDLCEMDLLCAISYFLDGKPEEAYSILDRILLVIRERRYDRLVADEGEKVYFLLRNYKKERQRRIIRR